MAAIGLADLPDDVRELVEPHAAENPTTLDAIGVALTQKREEAKAHRATSGIETTWRECEDAYIGIDELNRDQYQDGRWSKPMAITGPVTTGRRPQDPDHRSTIYIRLTARYVDAGAAKLAEILLPPDDKAFSFKEMPVPELIKAKEDHSQVVHDLGVPLTRPAAPGEPVPPAALPPAGAPAPAAGPLPAQAAGASPTPGAAAPAATTAPRVPLTVSDLALENIQLAAQKAKAAETRVYDWMVACQWTAAARKLIFDAARIGVGVLKGPVPKAKRQIAVITTDDGGIEIQIVEKILPVSVWVDPWNIFPDPACGDNIHDGNYIFERDYLSRRQVQKLRGEPGYIRSQIDKVLLEGPSKKTKTEDEGAESRGAIKEKDRFEIWYYYGSLKREEMDTIDAAAGKAVAARDNRDDDEVYAIVTMINDHPIKATLNPLDSGSFPYHSMPWQRRAKHWAGIGVAEQIKAPQAIVNASMRALLNNAGKSAGSQIVMDQGSIRPANGDWTLTPDKIWYLGGDGAGGDVGLAFKMFEVPNVTPQMLQILTTGERLAEESTSIPLITQGQSGETTPDTFGAAQLQNNNANQLLRDIGYNFDENITEPHVRQYYEWLLRDPDVPNEEKGEFTIDAHGSIALVERAIQDQTLWQMGALVTNPAFGINPKKWIKLALKSKRIAPQDLQYTDEEQARIEATPPPEPYQVTVAKIVADTAAKQLVAKQQTDQQTAASEERIAQAANALEGGRVQNEAQRTSVDATVRLHELQVQRELAMLEYANRHQINLDQVKADLAKTAMTLQTQRDLNAADNVADARRNRPARPRRGAAPPDQTPGRAGDGRAFEQGPPA